MICETISTQIFTADDGKVFFDRGECEQWELKLQREQEALIKKQAEEAKRAERQAVYDKAFEVIKPQFIKDMEQRRPFNGMDNIEDRFWHWLKIENIEQLEGLETRCCADIRISSYPCIVCIESDEEKWFTEGSPVGGRLGDIYYTTLENDLEYVKTTLKILGLSMRVEKI